MTKYTFTILVNFLLVVSISFAAFNCISSELDFKSCLDQVKKDAYGIGISENKLDSIFNNIEPDPDVIKYDRGQPEKIFTFNKYSKIFLTPERINNSKFALNKNIKLLNEIGKKYSIEPQLLVSLWSIETKLGEVIGNFNTVRSLATLTCDKRRPEFFRYELLSLINLIYKERLTLEHPVGSWAGAMGHMQFLPSVIEKYGVDVNNDNKIEIYQISEEVFATAANYLKESGWKYGSSWGYMLKAESDQCNTKDVKPYLMKNVGDNEKYRVITLDLSECKRAVVFGNYEALLKWNRSDYFAVTVGLLFDAISNN